MYFFEMISAFLGLFGIALFFRRILCVNTGEGMVLSVPLTALLLVISSVFGSFQYGMIVSGIIAVIGGIFWIGNVIKKGREVVADTFSPAIVFVMVFFIFSLFLYYNDFLRNTDEFHHWAATVRFMLNSDRMPIGMSFGNCAYITSVFLLYFQKFTGYSEQAMYVAMSLFVWIGFMLPFSRYTWKNWTKAAAYVSILYIAVFSLYSYGFKSLYVDIPLAAWAGGLAAWWPKCEKRKADYLTAISGLFVLFFCKASAGLLMACFVFLFIFIYSRFFDDRIAETSVLIKKIKKNTALLCGLVMIGSIALLGAIYSIEPGETAILQNNDSVTADTEASAIQQWSIAGLELPDAISNLINSVDLSKEKANDTLGRFVTKSFGADLASRSNLSIAFVPVLLLLAMLVIVNGDLYCEEKKSKIYIMYGIFTTLAYCAAVFFSFLLMFPYESSVEARSVSRYFSILVIYFLVLVLTELLQEGHAVKEKAQKYVILAVLIFFSLGLNGNFIPNATALDKQNASGYTKILETRELVNQVKNVISETDKVYFICQQSADNLSGADLSNNVVLYYLENQVSSYNDVPWKFTNTGSVVRLEEIDTSIQEFPDLLANGGYTYVWVHTTNPYLTRELPLVLPCDDEINSGDLYRVVYENGRPLYLELVQSIVN